MDIDFYPPPNPALTAILNGNQLRAISLAEAQRAKALYVATVARGDDPRYAADRLHDSASAFTEKTFTTYGSRWSGVLEVDSGHILPHDFGWEDERDQFVEGAHDLNHVLELL